jgi:hypothetical protein
MRTDHDALILEIATLFDIPEAKAAALIRFIISPDGKTYLQSRGVRFAGDSGQHLDSSKLATPSHCACTTEHTPQETP